MTAANMIEILMVMILLENLVKKIRMKQLKIVLMTQIISQILTKKLYNKFLFIIFDFDSNPNFSSYKGSRTRQASIK